MLVMEYTLAVMVDEIFQLESAVHCWTGNMSVVGYFFAQVVADSQVAELWGHCHSTGYWG